MTPQYKYLETIKRTTVGSKGAKVLRQEGKIPGIFYYKGEESINLSFDRKTFLKSLHSGGHIFELELDGNKQYAMIKEVQYHPITDEIIHIDLMRVRREEKITISVPITFVGEAIGVNEGGVMMQSLTSLEVSCLPENVPEQVTIDITELEMNSSLTVADISVSKELDILTLIDLTVVSVQPPKEEEEPVVEVEEEVLLDEEGVPIEAGEAEDDEKPAAEGDDASQGKKAASE